MHKNPLWLAFLVIVGSVTAWYGTVAILAVQFYVGLTGTASLQDGHWSVKDIASDYYLPQVRYSYQAGTRVYHGEMILSGPAARNEAAAEDLITELSHQAWVVWYNPTHPDRSSLQKSFPFKECLSAVTLLGIFVYLFWIGYSVGMSRS